MKKSILKKIAYSYFPRNINSVSEKDAYKNSVEFKKLESVINRLKEEKIPQIFFELKQIFQDSFSICLTNITSFEHFDRSYCFQLAKDNSVVANVYLSFIIPYYFVKMNPHLSFGKRLEEEISQGIEERTAFNKFPENLENELIEDVSFQDIKKGEFTFFNAFFSDENLTLA